MNQLNKDLDLCVFISTKSRYERTSDYKMTINHLHQSINLNSFKKRFVNIKFFKGDEENLKNIVSFFEKYNFIINLIEDQLNILEEDRYNNRQKFISGIAKDITNFFLKYKNKLSEYVFILEDDSPIIVKNGRLEDYINQSFIELENDKDLEGIHFARLEYNEIPISPEDWFILHKINRPSINENIIKNKYWYNFQPRVNKKEHLLNVCQIIQSQWDNYFKFLHPEDAFDKAYKIYNFNIKYYAFSPLNVYSIHLGTSPDIYSLVLNSEKDTLKLYNN